MRLGLLVVGNGGDSVLVRRLVGTERASCIESNVLALNGPGGELLRRAQSSVTPPVRLESLSLLLGEAVVAEGIAARPEGIAGQRYKTTKTRARRDRSSQRQSLSSTPRTGEAITREVKEGMAAFFFLVNQGRRTSAPTDSTEG